jgi:transposase InsO family protein
MDDQERREKIALFRFSLINPLLSRTDLGRGDQERMIREVSEREWEIPGSARSRITRATLLRWLKRYQDSGQRLESLQPLDRRDKGRTKCVDAELEAALVALRRELCSTTLPVFLKLASQRGVLPAQVKLSAPSLYRLFQRHGLERPTVMPSDRRRFEAELPNDLWQSDALHGPKVMEAGKLRQSFLFALIDDHSRLVLFARAYLTECLESFQDCLIEALARRGLPRKLYVDNGAAFRSHALRYACGRLGIALLHATPYTPEGKGKIERLFKTMRLQFFPLLPPSISLAALNERLSKWVEEDYHQRVHSSTGEKPLQRYLKHVSLLRKAPPNLREYFRLALQRKVDKDRTVSIYGRLYEAPAGLIGNTVTVLYHPSEMSRIEVLFQDRSWGFLVPLSTAANYRVRRVSGQRTELVEPTVASATTVVLDRDGKLFGRSNP